MIYLIGGVSKSGKTYIARKIMEEYNIPFLSTDILMWSLGDFKDNGLFSYYDNDSKVSMILKPYILKVISFLVKSNKDYLIEGTHITPSLVYELNQKYPSLFKSVFLGYKNNNESNKINEIISYEKDSDNLWYKVLSENDFKKFILNEINYSSVIENECIKYNLKYLDIDDIKNKYQEIKEILEIK